MEAIVNLPAVITTQVVNNVVVEEPTFSPAELAKQSYSSIVVNIPKEKTVLVNAHRPEWYDIYSEIRKLCVIKGERIRRYAPDFSGNSRKSIQFIRGKVRINEDFWESLKPAHKSQLRMIVNQISNLYRQLELAQ